MGLEIAETKGIEEVFPAQVGLAQLLADLVCTAVYVLFESLRRPYVFFLMPFHSTAVNLEFLRQRTVYPALDFQPFITVGYGAAVEKEGTGYLDDVRLFYRVNELDSEYSQTFFLKVLVPCLEVVQGLVHFQEILPFSFKFSASRK